MANRDRLVFFRWLVLPLGARSYWRPLLFSFFPLNNQTSLWLQFSFSITDCFHFTAHTSVLNISPGLLTEFYCQMLEIRSHIHPRHFQTDLKIYCFGISKHHEYFSLPVFRFLGFFCQSSKHGKTKIHSLVGRKRLWIFYLFKMQTNIT